MFFANFWLANIWNITHDQTISNRTTLRVVFRKMNTIYGFRAKFAHVTSWHPFINKHPSISSRTAKAVRPVISGNLSRNTSLFLSTTYMYNIQYSSSLQWLARYNWPHSFSCAARCGKRQISCHNKRYIQSRPRTGEVQTRHEYWHLVRYYAVIIARCGKLCM